MRAFLLFMGAGLSLMMKSTFSVTSEDFRVEGLEEIEPAFGTFEGDMYAGLLSIKKQQMKDEDEGGKLMFWLFQPDSPTTDDSLVIWLNGGPGCSSIGDGVSFEMGPVTTPHRPAGYFGQTDFEPYLPNPYSWTNATTMLYVEQPVGVGFSYGDDWPEDETEVARDFYNFLQNFYHVFPQQRPKRLYIVGESYAGMYAPSIAHYIYIENKKESQTLINLAGIGLGNGWSDANIQGPMVIDYAWWHGMIDSVTRDALHAEWKYCKQKTGSEPPPFHPFDIPDECGIMGAVLKASGAGLFTWGEPNAYDVTTWDPYSLINHPNTTNVNFYNDPRVRDALHAPKNGKPWAGCIPGAGRRRRRLEKSQQSDATFSTIRPPEKKMLDDDKPVSMVPWIAELLDEAGIQVLVYNGDRDLSTCAQGSETMLDGMEWSGTANWANPDVYRRGLWMVDGQMAGYAKAVKGLEFVVVYNSGHLVPFNQPVAALDLVTRLVNGKAFGDVDIPAVFKAPAAASMPPLLKKQEKGSSGWVAFSWVVLGFIIGITSTFVHSALKGTHTQHRYAEVGDVECEEQR